MLARLVLAGVFGIMASSHSSAFELVRGGKAAATIVVAEKAAEPERFAAAELQAFVEKATGARLALASKMPGGGQAAILVGETTVREAGDKFVAAAQFAQMRDDAYAIVTMDDPPSLLLLGRVPRGTLYAVYDLLETQLGIGFFVDGDYAAKQADAVVGALNIVANPAFADRAYYMPLGLYGPKRFQATLWNAEDWRAFLRWMAKKKLNRVAIPFTAGSRAWGAAFDQAFPEAKPHRQDTLAGVDAQAGVTARMGWGLNPEHTTALLKDAFAYARRTLGLEVTYVCVFGEFEQGLRQAMPGLKWKPPYPAGYPAAAGGSCALSAAEPKARELQTKLWKAILDTYGTDHSYVVCGEAVPGPVGSAPSQENTTVAALETMRQLDPAAQICVPTWEAPLWGAKPDARTAFVGQLPANVGLLYWDPDLGTLRRKLDTRFLTDLRGIETMMWASPQDILYTSTARLGERPIHYAVPWSEGPSDDLFSNRFGMLANCFHHFNHYVPAPKAVGFWNWHDLRRVNPMMDDLCAEFAWNATNVWRAEGALTNRAVSSYMNRRYGQAAVFPMAEAYKQALRGAPRAEGDVNYRAYVRWGTIPTPGSAAARGAVALALACKAAATDSPFYEADLVDLGRNYLHQYIQERCGQILSAVRDAKGAAAAKTYADQAKKDAVARLQKADAQLLSAHKALTRLIATRKDMCLDEAIIEATATKGANALLARAIREHQSGLLANGYPLTDSIEYHQQVAAQQLRHLLDYAKREVDAPTADAVPGWEVFFRQGASDFVEKAQPTPYDKKAEQGPASKILQEFLEAAE